MQDVTITFTDGPLRGRSYEFEVGRVLIGRLPGEAGLELKGADTSVSRVHAELVERGAGIELRNVSPNGTNVDDEVILDSTEIKPGARIVIGASHPFTVTWTSFEEYSTVDDGKQEATDLVSQGPLSSPIVRALMGIYLLGMVAVGLWLYLGSDDGALAADDWPALAAAYEDYKVGEISDELRSARASNAEALLRELRLLKMQGLERDTKRICREIMSIDKDSQSPLYQYGVRCLASQ